MQAERPTWSLRMRPAAGGGRAPMGRSGGGVGGPAWEGSRRDRGAIGAPHPCSWTSYKKIPEHQCRMKCIYIYMCLSGG